MRSDVSWYVALRVLEENHQAAQARRPRDEGKMLDSLDDEAATG